MAWFDLFFALLGIFLVFAMFASGRGSRRIRSDEKDE
jgi:hypothetical protein